MVGSAENRYTWLLGVKTIFFGGGGADFLDCFTVPILIHGCESTRVRFHF